MRTTTALSATDIEQISEAHVQGTDGKLGKVKDLFFDADTDELLFVGVNTGHFGKKEPIVPVTDAELKDGLLSVPYTKDTLKDAPRYDDSGELTADQQDEIWSYYLPGQTKETAVEPTSTTAPVAATTGDDTITRSEERLRVGTERVETGRARLRKVVVTEDVTVTVPVSHEEVRLVREPLGDGERVTGEIGAQETEIILHEERPIVAKETVAVERVHLEATTVSSDQQVTDSVRKEQIETDGIDPYPAGTTRDTIAAQK